MSEKKSIEFEHSFLPKFLKVLARVTLVLGYLGVCFIGDFSYSNFIGAFTVWFSILFVALIFVCLGRIIELLEIIVNSALVYYSFCNF